MCRLPTTGKIKRKLKKIRTHREGTNTLLYGDTGLVLIILVLWFTVPTRIPFWIFTVALGTVYGIVLNLYQCSIRYFSNEDTKGIIIAPADGHIVVIEEVDEDEYFHERRLIISIFMSLWSVHASWFPVDGVVKSVQHFDGNFHKAWSPKASEKSGHADTIIITPDDTDILYRQIAGAMVRRIMTYAKFGEDCYTGEHLGFIKLDSHVGIFLPIGSEICVKMGQATMGDRIVIARLKPSNK